MIASSVHFTGSAQLHVQIRSGSGFCSKLGTSLETQSVGYFAGTPVLKMFDGVDWITKITQEVASRASTDTSLVGTVVISGKSKAFLSISYLQYPAHN